jgi:hypothetical protein
VLSVTATITLLLECLLSSFETSVSYHWQQTFLMATFNESDLTFAIDLLWFAEELAECSVSGIVQNEACPKEAGADESSLHIYV